ncbi:hypothetical protein HK098_004269 [Nowakowskiella sp. JEL0407]|nr:hypothetical protein HK098_004269 [Nowakowskiella sp. JEL0407]
MAAPTHIAIDSQKCIVYLVINSNATSSLKSFNLKNSTADSSSYSTLLSFPFPIDSISLSPSKALIALTSTKSVTLVALPSCTSTSIDTISPPIKLTFLNNSNILYLSKDNTLTLYDLLNSRKKTYEIPPAIPPGVKKRGYINPVVSFCMGASSGWNKFTVFVMFQSGDIFALCPIIPFEMVIPLAHLTTLQSETKYLLSHSNVDVESKKLYWQLEYIGALLAQTPPANDKRMVTVYPPILNDKFTPACQGPITIMPIPKLNQERFLDVMAFQNDVYVAVTNKKLLVLKLVGEIYAEWNEIGDTADSEFNLLEVVALDDVGSTSVRMIRDPINENICFVGNDKSVYRADVSKWVKTFVDLEKSDAGAAEKLKELLKNGGVKLDYLIDLKGISDAEDRSGKREVVGMGVLTNLILGYSVVLCNDVGDFYISAIPLGLFSEPTILEGGKSRRKSKSTASNYKKYTIPEPLSIAHMIPQKNASKYPENVNENTLREFGNKVKGLRESMLKEYNEWTELESHNKAQQSYCTSIPSQEAISTSLQKQTEKFALTKKRMENISSKQAKLKKQSEILLQLALDLNQPVLNKEEKAWGKEVLKLSDSIAEIKRRVVVMTNEKKSLESKLDTLKRQNSRIEKIVRSGVDSDLLGKAESKKMSLLLSDQYEVIVDIAKRLETLKVDVDGAQNVIGSVLRK